MNGPLILDIGGEGRHPQAWNLNPRVWKTLGSQRGDIIPRLIRGRADAIPLVDDCVDLVIVERTPLSLNALREIQRVVRPTATVILRHAVPPWNDPHHRVVRFFGKPAERRMIRIGPQTLQETTIRFEDSVTPPDSQDQATVL